MRTVQMTIDEDLVAAVDREARQLGTTRSAFTRDALRAALLKRRAKGLEDRHRRGYEKSPVRHGEFDMAESEQSWGDE